MPGPERPDERKQIGVWRDAQLLARLALVLGREARRVEDKWVDSVRVEEHALRVGAERDGLLDEWLRDHHDQVGVAQVGALDRLGHGLEAQPLAPVALGPDLGAVELEHERHPQALAQQHARQVVEGVTLIDEVGRPGLRLLARRAQEHGLVAVRVDLERKRDQEARPHLALRARSGHERLLLSAQQPHREARAGERIRDARHVRHGAAHARPEAERRLEVEATTARAREGHRLPRAPTQQPAPCAVGRERRDAGHEACRDADRRDDRTPGAERDRRLARELSLAARSGHQEGQQHEVVLEEQELARQAPSPPRRPRAAVATRRGPRGASRRGR